MLVNPMAQLPDLEALVCRVLERHGLYATMHLLDLAGKGVWNIQEARFL